MSLPKKTKVRKKMSKAEVQLAIIKKRECDAKALTIVEKLLEIDISTEWLLENLKYINKSHLEDVAEERAITKTCGYVACKNPLTVTITQRYHISTRQNKVYDVSRRKNFCSSRCYGAYNYLLEQMLTSPLWLRDKEDIPVFRLLSNMSNTFDNTHGDEVCICDTNLERQDIQSDSHGIFSETTKPATSINVNDCIEDNICTLHSEKFKQYSECKSIDKCFKNTECSENDIESIAKITESVANVSLNGYAEKDKNVIISEKFIQDPVCEPVDDKSIENIHLVDTKQQNEDVKLCEEKNISEIHPRDNLNIRDTLQLVKDSCLTKEESCGKRGTLGIDRNNISNPDSVSADVIQEKLLLEKSSKRNERMLERRKENKINIKRDRKAESLTNKITPAVHVEQCIKEWITDDTRHYLFGEDDIKSKLLEDQNRQDKYLNLCKKLDKLEAQEEKEFNDNSDKDILKPLPHFSVLKEEGKKIELKIHAFYKGSMTVNPPTDSLESNDTQNVDLALPLLDAHAPKAVRRRILLDKLNKVLPTLLQTLIGSKYANIISRYTCSETCTTVRTLVNTFSLSATNISFKNAEWILVGLIIVKLLSASDVELRDALITEQAKICTSKILISYKLNENYLETLLQQMHGTL